ncbi:MAG: hypothetical protein WC595_03020 [Candidatus Nanoarchaeia archaeon]
MDEPQFLVNEFEEKDLPELNNVMSVLKVVEKPWVDRSVFLRDFMNNVFSAYVNQKYSEVKDREGLKQELEKKKFELVKKVEELKKQEQEAKIEKPIVFSKVTGKSLVSSNVENGVFLIKEPELTVDEIKLMSLLKPSLTSDSVTDVEMVKKVAAEAGVTSAESLDKMRYYLVRDFTRFGKLSALIENKEISEILCEGAALPLKVNYQGNELPSNVSLKDNAEINYFLQVVAQKTNTMLNAENSLLNVSLEGWTIHGNLGNEVLPAKFVMVRE